jgi:hypothetical protein
LAFSPHLDAFRALGPLDCGHALGALRPLDSSHALCALHSRRRNLLLRAHLLALRLRLLAFGTRGLSIFLRPRSGRGRDRQCGDARGEKYPGHHNFSFSTALTATGPHRSLAQTTGTCVLPH